MKTARLIKRNEIPTTVIPEANKTESVTPAETRRVVSTWIKDRERATPTQARRAFTALFSVPAGQVSC